MCPITRMCRVGTAIQPFPQHLVTTTAFFNGNFARKILQWYFPDVRHIPYSIGTLARRNISLVYAWNINSNKDSQFLFLFLECFQFSRSDALLVVGVFTETHWNNSLNDSEHSNWEFNWITSWQQIVIRQNSFQFVHFTLRDFKLDVFHGNFGTCVCVCVDASFDENGKYRNSETKSTEHRYQSSIISLLYNLVDMHFAFCVFRTFSNSIIHPGTGTLDVSSS